MSISRGSRATLLEVMERARAGHALQAEDGYRLMRARGAELSALMACAADLRDRGVRAAMGLAFNSDEMLPITYSRKVFIPLTNLCRDVCAYCTFARSPRDPIARTLTPEEVMQVARAGREAGCREALFSLGERPEERYPAHRRLLERMGYRSTTEYLAAMCDLVHRETGLLPHANCGVLERDELLLLRECNVSMGLMLESASDRLMEKGQAHHGCPGKVPARRLQTLREAGELGIACTSGILIGIGETLDERVDALLALRDLDREHGQIQEVIVQNFRAKQDTRMRSHEEPGAIDMARTIAVARLLLGPSASIQAPPNLTPDAYVFYLLAGINDWGGISPVTKDHINPEAAWPEVSEIGEATAEAGFRLRERLALYPRYFVGDAERRFVRGRFEPQLQEWTDSLGLVREELMACGPTVR